ncbi:MAG: hypothetical protein GY820_41310 [Gammaproteobacteria bacterium]|jgi:hypothetical protein|uniref:hypothetical protein n=1 Tax=Ralstonia sp. RRA TaxID=3122075 RepID=UPI002AE0B554|nr:hypothetical protein [Deltaproteobacteria bacterium]MCP4493699.1 hypothetical protein [Gammaproteobacteria bacterium]
MNNDNNKKEGMLKKVALSPLKFLNWTAKPVYMPVVNQVHESATRIKPLLQLVDPRSVKKIKANARVETYEQAKYRLGVSESDIDKNYRMAFYMAYMCFGFLNFFVILGILNLIDKNIMSGLMFLSFSCIHFANTVNYSFRAYRMKIRELCSFSKFMNDRANWIPTYRR